MRCFGRPRSTHGRNGMTGKRHKEEFADERRAMGGVARYALERNIGVRGCVLYLAGSPACERLMLLRRSSTAHGIERGEGTASLR